MDCPNCGAPMKPVASRDYLYCDHCGNFYFPNPSPDGVKVLGTESHLNCPVCHTVMVRAQVDGAPILACPKCKGLLSTQTLFPSIVQRIRARASDPGQPPRRIAPSELVRRLPCPHCGHVMDTHPYAGPGNVVVDVCIRCELIFLDYGELAIIRDAPGRR